VRESKKVDNVQKFVTEKYFFAKIAIWVKDGVPTHSANTPTAQLVLHPASF
jgi:hypothetical protein